MVNWTHSLKTLRNTFVSYPNTTRQYATAPQLSAVHRGMQFEERSIGLLREYLSMSLTRVGGKGDGGIDMLGWWWVPFVSEDGLSSQRRRIRVIAQCKAEQKKIGPKYVRELEGVLHRYYVSDRWKDVDHSTYLPLHVSDPDPLKITPIIHPVPAVGLLVSESSFTKATILCAHSSSIPLLLLNLPPEESVSSPVDSLGTAIWNPALAGNQGLLGGHMEIRWERSTNELGRPGLWWQELKLPSWTPET